MMWMIYRHHHSNASAIAMISVSLSSFGSERASRLQPRARMEPPPHGCRAERNYDNVSGRHQEGLLFDSHTGARLTQGRSPETSAQTVLCAWLRSNRDDEAHHWNVRTSRTRATKASPEENLPPFRLGIFILAQNRNHTGTGSDPHRRSGVTAEHA